MKRPKGECCKNCIWKESICTSLLSENSGLEVSDTNWCIYHYLDREEK
jgi:hypothetical protein